MTKKQKEICATFSALNSEEPDTSTEQLIARTADAHDCDYDDVVDALAMEAGVTP